MMKARDMIYQKTIGEYKVIFEVAVRSIDGLRNEVSQISLLKQPDYIAIQAWTEKLDEGLSDLEDFLRMGVQK